MKQLFLFGILVLALPAAGQKSATTGWFAFNPSVAVAPGAAADASDLLVDKPGEDPSTVIDRRGFVIARPDGRFYFSKTKRRVRFFGTNLTFGANFPPNKDAPPQPGEYQEVVPPDAAEQLATRLARMGVNLVRFHHMDNQNRPRGIWDPAFPNDTQHLDPLQVRRLDYLIYQLKRRGIYSNINLHVSRVFRSGDGVVEHDRFPPSRFNKGATQFDPVMIALQKKYASDLLGHVNPYTGLRLADDPAVAFVEITNEDSLFWSFRNDGLNHDAAKPETLPPHYSAQLDRRWNEWLRARYGNSEALAKAWQPAGADAAGGQGLGENESLAGGTALRPRRADLKRFTAARARDLLQFYFDLERDYFVRMAAHVRREAGSRALICGTAPFWFYPLDSEVQAGLDFIDGHIYFDHPRWPNVRPWSRTGWVMRNRPFASDPFTSLFNIAASAVAGKPFTLSETNQPYPNEYQPEWLLWTTAFGNFQDWDEVLQFDYGGRPDAYFPEASRNFFGIAGNAVMAAQMPVAARIFLGMQNRPAGGRLDLVAGHDELLLAGPGVNAVNYFKQQGVDASQAFRTAVRIARFEKGTAPKQEGKDAAPPLLLTSDNGELTLDRTAPDAPVFQVNAASLHALSGFLAGKTIRLPHLTAALAADTARFATITLQPVDGRPLASSERLLLTVLARQQNTGMVWNEEHTSVDDRWGTGPALLEPVAGTLTLRLKPGARFRVFALDSQGKRAGEVGAGKGEFDVQLDTGQHRTAWYELTRQ